MKMTKNEVVLTTKEQAAFDQAFCILAQRFEEAGEEYDSNVQESVTYCLCGALYTGGISGMMRYATETPIKKKRRVTA